MMPNILQLKRHLAAGALLLLLAACQSSTTETFSSTQKKPTDPCAVAATGAEVAMTYRQQGRDKTEILASFQDTRHSINRAIISLTEEAYRTPVMLTPQMRDDIVEAFSSATLAICHRDGLTRLERPLMP